MGFCFHSLTHSEKIEVKYQLTCDSQSSYKFSNADSHLVSRLKFSIGLIFHNFIRYFSHSTWLCKTLGKEPDLLFPQLHNVTFLLPKNY